MVGDPRSKLDIIYQEVLGEVSDLVGRVEAAAGQLTDITNSGDRAALTIGEASAAATLKIRSELDRTAKDAIQKLQAVVKDAEAAARLVDGSARRFALLALLTGLAGGIIGGILVGLTFSHAFFGS